jgi:hypothetical protein
VHHARGVLVGAEEADAVGRVTKGYQKKKLEFKKKKKFPEKAPTKRRLPVGLTL